MRQAVVARLHPMPVAVLALLVPFVLLSIDGCVARPMSVARPNELSAADSPLQLMTAEDHSRLDALADERDAEVGDRGYLIGPDDLLAIRIPDFVEGPASRPQGSLVASAGFLPVVAQAPVFEQGLRVDASGKVTLPLIGAVAAEGQTPTALEQTIAQRLKEMKILRAPEVNVQVAEYRSHVVAVVGSVDRPGLYPLTRPGATVADMIWAAGGPTKEAGRVVEFAPARSGESPGIEPIRIDLDTLLRANGVHDHTVDARVRPGDVITLAPAGTVLVDGWVSKPGPYPVTRGLTVGGAVAAAGGGLYPANVAHATVVRLVGSTQHSFPIDLAAVADGQTSDVPITDGDVVRVPPSPLRIPPWALWTLVQSMVRFGGTVAAY